MKQQDQETHVAIKLGRKIVHLHSAQTVPSAQAPADFLSFFCLWALIKTDNLVARFLQIPTYMRSASRALPLVGNASP